MERRAGERIGIVTQTRLTASWRATAFSLLISVYDTNSDGDFHGSWQDPKVPVHDYRSVPTENDLHKFSAWHTKVTFTRHVHKKTTDGTVERITTTPSRARQQSTLPVCGFVTLMNGGGFMANQSSTTEESTLVRQSEIYTAW